MNCMVVNMDGISVKVNDGIYSMYIINFTMTFQANLGNINW